MGLPHEIESQTQRGMAEVQGGGAQAGVKRRQARSPLLTMPDHDNALQYLGAAMNEMEELNREKMVLVLLAGKRPRDGCAIRFGEVPDDIIRTQIFVFMDMPDNVKKLYSKFSLLAMNESVKDGVSSSKDMTEIIIVDFIKEMEMMINWADANREFFNGDWFVPMFSVMMGQFVLQGRNPLMPEVFGVNSMLSLIMDFGESEKHASELAMDACRRAHMLKKNMVPIGFMDKIYKDMEFGLGPIKLSVRQRWRSIFVLSRQVYFGERGGAKNPIRIYDV